MIRRSCKYENKSLNFRKLHQLIIKKHYNATEVQIDYHRKRINLEVLADDRQYDPGNLNINLPTLRVNLLFKDLITFLRSCVETDRKSLAFYAWLLRTYAPKEVHTTLV